MSTVAPIADPIMTQPRNARGSAKAAIAPMIRAKPGLGAIVSMIIEVGDGRSAKHDPHQGSDNGGDSRDDKAEYSEKACASFQRHRTNRRSQRAQGAGRKGQHSEQRHAAEATQETKWRLRFRLGHASHGDDRSGSRKS